MGIKKKIIEDFSKFWNAFLDWLYDEDLPLLILIKNADARFANSILELDYKQTDIQGYNFALENKIELRLVKILKENIGEEIQVKILQGTGPAVSEKSKTPPLNPEWDADIRTSEKIKWEKLIRESFLVNFPDGKIEWQDRKSGIDK